MKSVQLIYRAPQFSPNAVEKDKAILDAVGDRLQRFGVTIRKIAEEQLDDSLAADAFLSMGRLPCTLDVLKRKATEGFLVVNSGKGVENMGRMRLDSLMRQWGIPVAPLMSDRDADGYWVKRGDASAQCKEDVIFAADRQAVEEALERFRRRGVTEVLVTEHVVGDLVKFYGVQGTDFFRCFYPTDDGITKFGDEEHNGQARHYAFSEDLLQREAERLSELTDVRVYGGDCIVREDGSFAIIDFNDWPSFSRCREEAAEAIARIVIGEMKNQNKR